jgi:Raf kinase inhibitor-like YbhB/YbcL family protein
MTMSIPAFPDGGTFPVEFSQAAAGAAEGQGPSPAITWATPPEGTQSFVLHFHDLEVARQRTTTDQVHWLVWNIPGTSTGLPEAVPMGSPMADGSQQISATGPVYRGPGARASGPPHHYLFELYALDAMIDVQPVPDDAFATRTAVMEAMNGHVLGKTAYVGTFRRPA